MIFSINLISSVFTIFKYFYLKKRLIILYNPSKCLLKSMNGCG
jgi:hypothetical protein